MQEILNLQLIFHFSLDIQQSWFLLYRVYDILKRRISTTFEQYPILILPCGELNSLFVSDKRAQLDSSGVRRRLKLKGDLETECSSNRWWPGRLGGMAARARARLGWLMGLLQECWSLLAIPRRLYLDDSRTSRHTNTHTRTLLHARILTARGNMWTYFLSNARSFKRISLSLLLDRHSYSMEIPVWSLT